MKLIIRNKEDPFNKPFYIDKEGNVIDPVPKKQRKKSESNASSSQPK